MRTSGARVSTLGRLADCASEAVAHRILDAQREEIETLERAALRGQINADAARDVEALRPVQFVAGAVTQADASRALETDAVARRILAKGIEIEDGELVGARLNINVLKNTGVAVNTIHRGNKGEGYKANKGLWGGEVKE